MPQSNIIWKNIYTEKITEMLLKDQFWICTQRILVVLSIWLETQFSFTKNQKVFLLRLILTCVNGWQFRNLGINSWAKPGWFNGTTKFSARFSWYYLEYRKKYIHLQFGNIIELCQNLQPTKTNILRIEEILDHPLGLISSIALPFKFILQRLFKLKTHWNNRINVETNEFW